MNRPAMAREMLLAEAIGDLALVLDRLDRLLPAHERATEALVKAHTDLDARTDDFKRSIISFTDQAKAHTAKHIAHHVVEASRVAREAQTQAWGLPSHRGATHGAEIGPTCRQPRRTEERLRRSTTSCSRTGAGRLRSLQRFRGARRYETS